MKTLITIIVLLFFSTLSFSQEYFTFPQSNALWNYKIVGSMVPPYEWTVIDSLGEEISIGALQYIKIYREEHVVGAIREDTILKKIYFHNFSDEIVLYDFALEVGDTIYYTTNLFYILNYYKIVDSIDSISINGKYRKRWHLTNSLYGMIDIWIEGIGSVYRYGLLYPNDPDIVLDGSTPYFGCFTHDSTIYINENACISSCPCSWWIVNVNDFSNKTTGITVFPNPFFENLTMESPSEHIDIINIQIYNTIGSLLVNTTLFPNEKIMLDVSSLPNGIYILKATSSSLSSFQKIIKCK